MSNFGPPPGVTGALPVQSHSPAPAPQDTPQQDTRVVVGPCVLSYPKLFTPEPKMGVKDAPLEYSCELLVYQSNPQMQAIYQKLHEVANRVSMATFRVPVDRLSKQPFRNLAEREGSKEPGFFFTARTGAKYAPQIFVGNPPQPCTDPAAFYAGAIVYVNLNCGSYDNSGNKGVKFFLNSVLKVADGERLAPLRNAADDFAEVLASLPQTPAAFAPPAQPMQQYVSPPQGYVQPPAPTGYPPQQGYAMPPMPGYPQQ